MADEDHQHEKQTLKSYYELLRDSPCFRILWIGEVMTISFVLRSVEEDPRLEIMPSVLCVCCTVLMCP
jgi:hypothetical protein